MQGQQLALPCSAAEFHEIADRARTRYERDLSYAVPWLATLKSETDLRRRIVEAWLRSGSPLAEWVGEITRVVIWVAQDRSFLWLEVLVDSQVGSVIQSPPMPPSIVARCTPWAPDAVKFLASAAPGLRLGGHGGFLVLPDYVLRPIGYARKWLAFQREFAPDAEELLAAVRQLDDFRMEVADDGLGNVFLLRRDGRIAYIDHLEHRGFLLINLDAHGLIRAYFEYPDCLKDEPFLGLR